MTQSKASSPTVDSQPTTITIDPEFAALIPPLTDQEKKNIEESLKRDGCLDPLIIWGGRKHPARRPSPLRDLPAAKHQLQDDVAQLHDA